MYDKCFLCLNNTSNKICRTCNCFCHPKCWGEYLQNITNPIMILDSIKCPICKKDIINVKSLTRNDTYILRKHYFKMKIIVMLVDIKILTDIENKIKLANSLFNFIIYNKKIMKDCGLEKFVKDRLNHLYYYNNWTAANIYHLRIFGEQLVK